MKRVLPILIVLSLLAALLAGCNAAPKPTEPTGAATEAPAPEPPTATVPQVPATGETPAPTGTAGTAPGTTELPTELPGEPHTVELSQPEPIRPAQGPEEITRSLASAGSRQFQYPADDAPAWEQGETAPEQDPGEGAPTGTNVQVAGVDEGDTVKTDGDYIYMLDAYGLVIVSCAGKDSEIVSYTKVDYQGQGSGWAEKLYLWEDRVVVLYSMSDFGTDPEGAWYDVTQVRAAVFDVSNRARPKLRYDTAVDGTYLASQLVDGTLCLVTQKYLWSVPDPEDDFLPCVEVKGKTRSLKPEDVYICPNPNSTSFTIAAAISLETGKVTGSLAFTDGTSTVYMDREGLYLARSVWSEGQSEPYQEGNYTVVDYLGRAQTEIKHLRLEEGALRLETSCLIEGSLLNQFALDGKDGYLRAASTEAVTDYSTYTDEAHGWVNYQSRDHRQTNRITVLDQNLQVVGTLEGLAPDERIYACRFLGDLAYVVTFRETDPVLTVDLSDPANPTLAGQLELPGVSMYLQGFGPDRLFGFGSAVEEPGLLLNLFDVSDPANVKLADQRIVGDYQWSVALYDHRAILADAASGLIGFPGTGEKGTDYAVFRIQKDSIQPLGAFALEYLPDDARGLLIGGLLYVCSPGVTYVADPERLEVLTTVSNAVG